MLPCLLGLSLRRKKMNLPLLELLVHDWIAFVTGIMGKALFPIYQIDLDMIDKSFVLPFPSTRRARRPFYKGNFIRVANTISGKTHSTYPTNNKDKVITLGAISSHTFGDIEVKPSRGDGPRSNLGGEGC